MKPSASNPVIIRFKLKSEGERPLIYATISYGQKYSPMMGGVNLSVLSSKQKKSLMSTKYTPIKLSTQISIVRSFWNQSEQKSTVESVNTALGDFKSSVILLYHELAAKGDINREHFIEQIKTLVLNHEAKKKDYHLTVVQTPTGQPKTILKNHLPTILTDYIDFKIVEWRNTRAKKDGTFKAFGTLQGWLLKFEEEELEGNKIDLLTLDNEIVKEFKAWILRQRKPAKKNSKMKKHDEKYKQNYLDNLITRLKVFINEAKDQDRIKLSDELNLKNNIFKKVSEEVDDIYLTVEQLNVLKAMKFKEEDYRLESIRNMAVVMANCGFRYSDFKNLRKLYLIDGEYHFILQKSEKTKTKSIIPVMDEWVVDLYLNHYKGTFTWNEYESKFNKYVKKLFKKAGFTEVLQQTFSNPSTKGNYHVFYKMYEKISSRTFRKTFASNCIREYGVSIPVCMSWTGHQEESSFKHYIRLNEVEYGKLASEQIKKEKLLNELMKDKTLFNRLMKKVG